ncbi:nucleosome remodeling complex, CAF-I subunit [Myriangium duriaei CBS 260.36]|uniref:Nucleosome remodeling complex, CAF-I subunit n=1 Tax=Myriangium duriaei CBS 260.36 TaxID=1168546 RepID=A0A9P4MHS3_9PEZI|nr:nucleosome remodeling complex, CAF-I subunit [Myriangium duriaei CBS 260.36]
MAMDESMTDAVLQHEQSAGQIDNKLINEEYKIWKKNAVFLYDVMYSRALEWPSLTTQWLPDYTQVEGKNFTSHRLLIGTHTSDESHQNYLQIAHINFPNKPPANPADYDADREEIGGYGSAKERIDFEIKQKICHPGEVNKARYMPQNPNIIATMTNTGTALIFDRTKHPLQPKDNNIVADVTLAGHESEGYALDWNRHVEGQIITGSEDRTVRLWDIKDFSKADRMLSATKVFKHHSSVVNDVQFHPLHGQNLFGSVSDDKTFCLIDLRSDSTDRPAIRIDAHTDAVNTLAFHPKQDVLFATGSADKSVGVFDLRFPGHGKIHALEGHKDVVNKVDWHPQDSAILATSSDDRRIIFWDLSRAGMEQTPEDAEDGPPEMLFMHGGHTARVSDFSWNLNEPWVMCSVAEDNLIQCWRASRALVETLPPGITQREISPA